MEIFLSFVGEGHHMLFGATQETMGRLQYDPSPEAIVDACVTYNMYAEGVSAESSYWYIEQALGSANKMPGLLKGISHLKRDESRHIAFGLYMLQRQISENPHLLDRALEKLQSYEPITAMISAEFIRKISFGVTPEAVTQFADKQLRARLSILEKARSQTLEEIFNTRKTEIVL